MTRLPRPTGGELIAALRRSDFELVRIRGSHHLVRHPDGSAPEVAARRAGAV